MSSGISSRNPISVHEGGRGGAGNIGHGGGGREYVDGGMYRTEEPGADGKPYSTGRGGYGNMGEGTPRASVSGSTHRDNYAKESVVPQKEGESSGGRGGAGNIGAVTSQDKLDEPAGTDSEIGYGRENNPRLERRRLSSGMSHLGLADKMKYGILSMMKKD